MSALQIIQDYLETAQYPVKSFWDTETAFKLTVIVMGDLILKQNESHNKNSLNLLMGEADHQLI